MNPTVRVLMPRDEWRALEVEHQARADALSAGWRSRRQAGETHAVDDFLFTYYPYRPSLLRRWHPGVGVALEGAGADDRAGYKWYREATGSDASSLEAVSAEASSAEASNTTALTPPAVVVDAAAFVQAKSATLDFLDRLLRSTASRPAQFGCFGLHEWAMVYRVPDGAVRHEAVPLRLTAAETDEVVEQNHLVCSHIDAYRFFTPPAVPRNAMVPTRENQVQLDQPGCLHAGMDVYKWAIKLGPLVDGPLLLDSFELARDIRQLDMQASPYDVSAFGLAPVRIETRAGKAEYARRQRGFAERSNILRGRLVAVIAAARESATVETGAPAAGA